MVIKTLPPLEPEPRKTQKKKPTPSNTPKKTDPPKTPKKVEPPKTPKKVEPPKIPKKTDLPKTPQKQQNPPKTLKKADPPKSPKKQDPPKTSTKLDLPTTPKKQPNPPQTPKKADLPKTLKEKPDPENIQVNDFVAIWLEQCKYDIGKILSISEEYVEVQYYKRRGRAIKAMKLFNGKKYTDNTIHKKCIIYIFTLENEELSNDELNQLDEMLKETFKKSKKIMVI